ncbi:hypothetical protein BKA61DRAFT_227574 [Leptodontidium sp. MPI-SDFR-AT-0119]|nr:hypothetical protein BKA61DRAFT_227574 [Leptodontidium sp. MPI-SDFR-AT-0119]
MLCSSFRKSIICCHLLSFTLQASPSSIISHAMLIDRPTQTLPTEHHVHPCMSMNSKVDSSPSFRSLEPLKPVLRHHYSLTTDHCVCVRASARLHPGTNFFFFFFFFMRSMSPSNLVSLKSPALN